MSRSPLFAGLLLIVPALTAQNRSADLVNAARDHIGASRFDTAEVLLREALTTAPYILDSATILMWRGVIDFLRGSDSLTRVHFRQSIGLAVLNVQGLDRISPRLQELYSQETRARIVYLASNLQQPPVWQSGPAIVYPRQLRHISGRATVRAVVDTLGRVEEQTINVLEVPDSGFVVPLTRMMLEQRFTPGRRQGAAVRSMVSLGLNLSPPPRQNPTVLVRAAHEQLRARPPGADSALVLLEDVLDSGSQASQGERVYAQLVQGIAWRKKGQDSLAAGAFDSGLAGYRELTARGVDLAPFLRRLADSIRLSRRPAAPKVTTAPFARPTTVERVDEQPALLAHPPIRYAPEMQALRIGGTVIVEAALDTTGRIVPASVKIVQSPNPVFDAEARRVVVAATYRPARIAGHAARVTIRQPITFAAY